MCFQLKHLEMLQPSRYTYILVLFLAGAFWRTLEQAAAIWISTLSSLLSLAGSGGKDRGRAESQRGKVNMVEKWQQLPKPLNLSLCPQSRGDLGSNISGVLAAFHGKLRISPALASTPTCLLFSDPVHVIKNYVSR